MGVYLVTAPTAPAVSLIEAKQHLELTDSQTERDAYILGLIAAAERQVQDQECGGLQLLTGTYIYKMDAFPSCPFITVPRAPLISVTSVTYIDESGVEQTFGGSPVDQYVVDEKSPHLPEFGEIHLAYGESWPVARAEHNAVRVRFTCGFSATAFSVPADIKAWMKLLIGSMYATRELEVTGAIVSQMKFADNLLNPYRVRVPRVA